MILTPATPRAFWLLAVTVVAGIAPAAFCQAPPSPPADPVASAEAAATAFQTRCAHCHSPEAPRVRGHFGFITDLPRLAAEPKYIVPGDPEASFLWRQIEDAEMPPTDSDTGQLTAAESDAIFAWIQTGAHAPAARVIPSNAGTPIPTAGTGPTNVRSVPDSSKARGLSSILRIGAFIGRFHVLVIHFPIAFLIAAAGAELWNLARPSAPAVSAARLLLALGAAAALVAAPLGWLNAIDWSGGSVVTLNLHRWLGTAAGAVAPFAFFLSERDARRTQRTPLTRAAVVLVAATAGVAAHFGGMLVYGSSYFTP